MFNRILGGQNFLQSLTLLMPRTGYELNEAATRICGPNMGTDVCSYAGKLIPLSSQPLSIKPANQFPLQAPYREKNLNHRGIYASGSDTLQPLGLKWRPLL